MASANAPNNLREDLRDLMTNTRLIRNVAIVGQLKQGKSLVVDVLVSSSLPVATLEYQSKEEIEMTEKSIPYSLLHAVPGKGTPPEESEEDIYLFNIIDTPGHIDFSAEVTTALRITDGSIVVIDCISGCCVQTENVLKLAIRERNKTVLFLNKMDRLFLEFYLDKEEIYQILKRSIDAVNIIISTYVGDPKKNFDLLVDPSNGSVIFGSIFDEWCFSVKDFAEIYGNMFNTSTAKIMDKLWGDDFFNSTTKRWVKSSKNYNQRGFSRFILSPIIKLFEAIMNFQKSEIDRLIETLKIKLSPEDQAKEGKDLLRVVMQSWLPAAVALSKVITLHLPSPVVAQRYRAKILYEGPNNDSIFKGISTCDSQAPLMMYVSNMIPANEEGKFYAFGRVFSGELSYGQTATFMGPKYKRKHGKLPLHIIGQPVLITGDCSYEVKSVPVGNLCGIIGVDKYLAKSGTISDDKEARIITKMKFSVSPVVQIKIEPMNPSELPEVITGLKRLSKSDPLVEYFVETNGEHILGVSGEMHMKSCLKDLENKFASAVLKIPDPVVSIREAVSKESTEVCSAKSPNQHNRIFMTAQPLPEDLPLDIENDKISQEKDNKIRNAILKEYYKFDDKDASSIWCFGPDNSGPNLLIDRTIGVKDVNDIEKSVILAFQTATKEGPLCEEPMRGVRFHLCDALLQGDKSLRESGQVIPTVLRALYASFLTAYPRIHEPMYLCEIQCPMRWLRKTYECVALRRGVIFEEYQVTGTSMYILRSHIPILESFGLEDELQNVTEKEVSTQSIFDHWQPMIGNPLDCNNSSAPNEIVMEVRKRKGLSDKLPEASNFMDKLQG